MKLSEARLLFLDLQTTGAKPDAANILEVAWTVTTAAQYCPDEIQALLVKQPPDVGVPPRIQAITGITNDDMEHAVDLARARMQLTNSLDGSIAQTVIHYAQFERPFLSAFLPEISERTTILCTHQIAARLFPNLPSRGIRGLAGFFGNPIDECKRATSHVDATVFIWRNLCRELAMRGVETFEELHEWLQLAATKRTKYEYPLDTKLRLALPDTPGVYRMLSRTGAVLYVGKATSLNSRVNSYFRGKRKKDARKLEMLTQTWNLDVTVCESVLEACLLEVDEIKRLSPPYNVALKVADRALVFYDREFTSASTEPGGKHPVGPFRSDLVMAPLAVLAECVAKGDFEPQIFFDEVDPLLQEEAFAVWLERHKLRAEQLRNARSLLAHGMRNYREYLRWLVEQAKLQAVEQDSEEADELSLDDEDFTDEGEPEELSAEDVADRYDRLLMRSARFYLLSKRLTTLLNADVEFQEGVKLRRLYVRNGCISSYPVAVAEPNASWSGLGLNVYDRMRVLDTELRRILTTGGKVFVTPARCAPFSDAGQWLPLGIP